MWVFTEVADWFEKNRSESEEILDQWVEDSNYSVGSMVAASTTKAFMTFGAGFVDILRLGDGVQKGTLKGVGEDALRFVAVFPVGKTAQLLKSTRGVSAAKLIADTGGPNCFWVASAKALRQIGQKQGGKLFASVQDVATALKMPFNQLWRIPNLATGIGYLKRLGVRTGAVKTVLNSSDVIKLVPRDGSVVMVAVKVVNNGKQIGAHAVYYFRNSLGQIRVMDRTVGRATTHGTQGVYKSLEELKRIYGATDLIPFEAAVLYNVFVKSVAHELPRLVIPVLGVMAEEG